MKPFYSLGYFLLGELCADTDQGERALGNLKEGERIFREMGMDY